MSAEQQAAANSLAAAVEATRQALSHGSAVDFGHALFAMFASLDAYRQAGEAKPQKRARKVRA